MAFTRLVAIKSLRLSILVLGFLSSFVYADDFWVLTNPEPPFIVLDNKSNLSGYPVELVQAVLDQANIKQKILTAPWPRVEKEARTKANVLVFALARTPEREADYYWITPITAAVFGLYAKKKMQFDLKAFEDIRRLNRIGVLKDDARHIKLKTIVPEKVSAYDSWQNTVSALFNDEVSAVFFSDAGLEIFCYRLKKDCEQLERIYTYQLTHSYLALSMPGTDPELAKTLTQAASQFKKSKKYTDMSHKWLAHYKNTQLIPMHLANGVLNLWHQKNPTNGNNND